MKEMAKEQKRLMEEGITEELTTDLHKEEYLAYFTPKQVSFGDSIIKKYINLFSKGSIENEVYAHQSLHLILGQLFKDIKFYVGTTTKDLRFSCFIIKDSGCLDEGTLVLLPDNKQKPLNILPKEFMIVSYSHELNKDEITKAIKIDSGEKEVFELKLMDGRIVRASSDHVFFVKRNDKLQEIKLKDLKVGDEIFCKHSKLSFSLAGHKFNGLPCPKCNRVHKDKTGENNPSSCPKVREKMSETRIRLFSEGKIVSWCKGLTKETDERVRKIGEKLKGRPLTEEAKQKMRKPKSNTSKMGRYVRTEVQKNKVREKAFERWKNEGWVVKQLEKRRQMVLDGTYKKIGEKSSLKLVGRISPVKGCKFNGQLCGCGKVHPDMTGENNSSSRIEVREKLKGPNKRKGRSGENNPSFGKITYPKPRYVGELGHNVRSKLEEQICRELKKSSIPYQYEPERFVIEYDGSKKTYTPDIRLSDNLFLEIKAFIFDCGVEKLKYFHEQYPNIRLLIVTDNPYVSTRLSFFQNVLTTNIVEVLKNGIC